MSPIVSSQAPLHPTPPGSAGRQPKYAPTPTEPAGLCDLWPSPTLPPGSSAQSLWIYAQAAQPTSEKERRERKPVLEAGGAGAGSEPWPRGSDHSGPGSRSRARAWQGAEPAQTPLLRKWGAGKMGAGSEPEDRRGRFLADVGSEKGRKWPRQLLNIWNHRITRPSRMLGWWGSGKCPGLLLPASLQAGSVSSHCTHLQDQVQTGVQNPAAGLRRGRAR